MNKIISISLRVLIIIIATSLFSCRYNEIVDADYNDQIIYIPIAKNGIYTIHNPESSSETPTSGGTYSFFLDSTGNNIVVPLGVYRAGVSQKGDVSVDIIIDEDTVSQLIVSDGLPQKTELLPSEQFKVPETVQVKNNEDHCSFFIYIDYDFLKQNMDKKFAVGIRIACENKNVNPKLNTAIVLIDPSLILK